MLVSVNIDPAKTNLETAVGPGLLGRLCLAVVVAHPDDDLRLCGGIVALHARRPGFRFVLVHATSGEAGMIASGSPATQDTLGSIREEEDRASWTILGRSPDRHVWLHYPDGGVAALVAGELSGALKAVFAAELPDVVITFGPDGITGHPDHVAVSAATTEAFHRVRASSSRGFHRLVYAAVPQSLAAQWDGRGDAADESPEPLYRLRGIHDSQINLSVDCSQVAPCLLAALRRHESQANELAGRSTEELLAPLSHSYGVIAWPPAVPLMTDVFEGLDIEAHEGDTNGNH
jgi:LmbE family N-acetylglucosaminyl deacetylase